MLNSWFGFFLILTIALGQKKGPAPAEINNQLFQKGDCIAFKTDSGYYGAAIIYYLKGDRNNLLYGFCFLDYADSVLLGQTEIEKSRLSGRKIERINDTIKYIIGVDIQWLPDSCIIKNKEKIKWTGHYDFKHQEIGYESTPQTYSHFLFFYHRSRERRSRPPDSYLLPYSEKTRGDYRPDEYFPVKDFILTGNQSIK